MYVACWDPTVLFFVLLLGDNTNRIHLGWRISRCHRQQLSRGYRINLDDITQVWTVSPPVLLLIHGEARLLTWELRNNFWSKSMVFCTIWPLHHFVPNLVGLELTGDQGFSSLNLHFHYFLALLVLSLTSPLSPAPLYFQRFTNKILGTMLSVKIGRKRD